MYAFRVFCKTDPIVYKKVTGKEIPMKKKLFSLAVLLLCALFLLFSCAPAYEGDARIGTYAALGADGETVVYRLTLEADGTGEMIHYPTIGGETREDIIFEFKDDTLYLHGTEVVGGVIGRNELSGTLTLEGDVYTFELRSGASGTPLANFVQE